MERKKNMLVFVAGILMIIIGIIGIAGGALAIVGGGAVVALGGAGGLGVWAVLAGVLSLVTGVFSLIAGIMGAKNAAKPEKGQSLFVFGIITVVMAVLGIVFSALSTAALGGGAIAPTSFVSLVIPIIYVIGAMQLKKQA